MEGYYLGKKTTIAKAPFYEEERKLIDAVAERLGKTIERMETGELLKKSEEKYRKQFDEARAP